MRSCRCTNQDPNNNNNNAEYLCIKGLWIPYISIDSPHVNDMKHQWCSESYCRTVQISSFITIRHTGFDFWGVFAELRKANINFVVSVYPSVRSSDCSSAWNNSVTTGRIFMKLGYWALLEILLTTFKFY